MSTLLPSGLVKPDSGVQGWDVIINDNWDLLDNKLEEILTVSIPNRIGSQTQTDASAATAQSLTDSTTGTPSDTIPAAGVSYSESTINDINASFIDEINKLRADNENLRTTLNDLIGKLETMGVLAP